MRERILQDVIKNFCTLVESRKRICLLDDIIGLKCSKLKDLILFEIDNRTRASIVVTFDKISEKRSCLSQIFTIS